MTGVSAGNAPTPAPAPATLLPGATIRSAPAAIAVRVALLVVPRRRGDLVSRLPWFLLDEAAR